MEKSKQIKKKLPFWLRIMIAMVLGIVWGLITTKWGLEAFTSNWVKPWGNIFINMLKLISIPLIFLSLLKGITSVTDMSKLRSLSLKTLGLYFVTTIISAVLGLLLVNSIKPGASFSEEKRINFYSSYYDSVKEKEEIASDIKKKSPLQFIEDMVPDNIIAAAGDNSKMLQIIFISVLFSISIILIGKEKTDAIRKLVDTLNEIILKIVDLAMLFAPFGVFSLLSSLIADFSGDIDLFFSVGKYAGLTFFGIIFLVLSLYPLLIILFTKYKVKDFLQAMFPAQIVAFSTSSSAATLPVTLKQCIDKLQISPQVANFVLPVGVTVNMNGTAFYQAVSAIFIAQVFGLDLSISQQIAIILTATISSIGAPGVPGGGVIMLVIVLSAAGIPAAGLALILGIERPLDMIRTVANITGDAAVALIVNSSESREK